MAGKIRLFSYSQRSVRFEACQNRVTHFPGRIFAEINCVRLQLWVANEPNPQTVILDVITGALKSWRFGTETTHLTWANTYPDAETAESGELTDYIESESDRFGAYDGVDVKTEGRLAWTDGTIPTTEFDHLSPDGPGDSITTAHASYRNPF